MGESKLSPLQYNVQIVNPDGTPTPYFIQLLQQLYDEKNDISDQVELTAGLDIIAGAGLSGGGPLDGTAGDITLTADVQAILNLVTTTRGAILYRGAAAWSALLPGTAGNFLKTNGAGADPAWAASSAGATWDFLPPTAASMTLLSGDATNLTLTDDANVGLLVDHGAATGSVIFRTAYRTLTSKALDWTLVAKIKRLHENRNFRAEGLIIMDSISGRVISFELRNDQLGPCVFEYTNLTGTFTATLYAQATGVGQEFAWQRIRHTGGNYLFDVSADGKRWSNVATVGDVAFLTNRADRVGLMSLAMNVGGYAHGFSIPYFSLTGAGV